jgi:hypothetical protein
VAFIREQGRAPRSAGMIRPAFAALGLTLAPLAAAHAAPGDMSVAVFLAKADGLRAKGPMALFSSDIKLLKAEGQAAGEAYRARLTREQAAGTPSSCIPRGAKVGSDQVMAHLNTYPAAARPATTMRTAMADYFMRTYPCRR